MSAADINSIVDNLFFWCLALFGIALMFGFFDKD